MTGAEFLAAELARIAYIDGHEEGLKGMLAVAFTIRNRVNMGWMGSDWQKVLNSHTKWRAYNSIDVENVPDPRNFAFQNLLQEITGVFYGYKDDDVTVLKDPMGAAPTIGVSAPHREIALYYGRIDKIDREWFIENISRNTEQHRVVAQVGLLHFWS
jgi:hypothetical protein